MSATWSINPLLRTTLPKEALVKIIEDKTFLSYAYVVFIVISVSYPIVHQLLKKRFQNYKQLGSLSKQIVVLHHAVEAIVLTMIAPFFTYFMIKINFVEKEEDEKSMAHNDRLSICISALLLPSYDVFL